MIFLNISYAIAYLTGRTVFQPNQADRFSRGPVASRPFTLRHRFVPINPWAPDGIVGNEP